MRRKKQIFISSFVLLFFFFQYSIYGDEISKVNIGVNENEISVSLENVTNLYSASFDLKYDPEAVEIKEIIINEEINKGNILVAFNDLAYEGNRVRFGFTFVGAEEEGISGNTNFLTIKFTTKQNKSIELKEDLIKAQLVEKKNGTMENMKYQLVLHSINPPPETPGETTKEPSSNDSLDSKEEPKNNTKEDVEDNLNENNDGDEEKPKENSEENSVEDSKDEISSNNSSTWIWVGVLIIIIIMALVYYNRVRRVIKCKEEEEK